MAQLFVHNSLHAGWALISAEALESAGAFHLTPRPEQPLVQNPSSGNGHFPKLMMMHRDDGRKTWVLLVRHGRSVRVNGVPVVAGIRKIEHRDEICVGPNRLIFSTETPVAVRPFRGAGQAVTCPRCAARIQAGQDAVACPECGAAYHQSREGAGEFACWSYGSECAVCRHPTGGSSEVQWTPEPP